MCVRNLIVGVAFILLAHAGLHATTLPSGFTESLVASGISAPTAMAFAPDGRLFVCEQGGRLRVIKDGALLPTPFLTVDVNVSVERGLLGVALDPQFATNHYVYIYYTVPAPPIHNRVSRFTAQGDVASPGSEVLILELNNLSLSSSHNGGAMHFRNDGKLYVAVGDDQNPANAQTLNNTLGKILRINKDGTIPTDNPFYGVTTGTNRAIWALGLRNPFTFAFQPGTGRMFINDVGQVTWEEIDEGIAGANYGWATCEGRCATPNQLFTDPLYQYGHGFTSTTGCAITGGAFYNPQTIQYPSDYVGDYFFADYCGGWIRRFDPASNTVAGFATGINSPVDLQVGPDGNLYYLAIGDGGAVYKVQYALHISPNITLHPASQTVTAGRRAVFSVSAYGTQPLAYQWRRNGINIAGANSASYTLTTARLTDDGAQFSCLVSNSFGSATSNSATLSVTTNVAPTGTITSPAQGSLYSAGETITYAGSGADLEDGSLPPSAFTWQVDFQHDTHRHPFIAPRSGAKSGSFIVPVLGETAPNVWYRIYLTVKDSGGFTHTSYRDIKPRKSKITLATSPAGLQVKLDSQPRATPFATLGVVGLRRSLGVISPQIVAGKLYEFVSWSDGGGAEHSITTPSTATTYTAVFRVAGVNPNHVISFDFDGDGKDDLSVRRPGTGAWINLGSASGATTTLLVGDRSPDEWPVPGDYDGDGRTDAAVWQPGGGNWHILPSSVGSSFGVSFGMTGDQPVPADYDGDGKTDIAVFRPTDGSWRILNIYTHTGSGVFWGTSGDKPVPGDYDADGKTDVAVWRPSTGNWHVIKSSDGAFFVSRLGADVDQPVPADYDGDGKTDLAVFRPSTSVWTILRSSDGVTTTRQWGRAADILAPADYDADGKTDLAVWRPSTSTFYIIKSSDGLSLTKKWGSHALGDFPVAAAYIR